jgi:PEGA domain
MRLLLGTVLILLLFATATVSQNPTSTSLNTSGGTVQDSQSNGRVQANAASKDDRNSGHKYHLRFGTLALTGGYISGPFWYPFAPYGYYPYYGLAFWDPFWGPFSPSYYPADLTYGNGKGQIELKADPKNAQVYIDGAYAGTIQHLKHIWLDPGAYDLSISAAGRAPVHQRIYVLTGKTVSIDAKLSQRESVGGGREEKQE